MDNMFFDVEQRLLWSSLNTSPENNSIVRRYINDLDVPWNIQYIHL